MDQQPGHWRVWVGIDVGKGAHHAAAVDGDGQLVWSRRVANDQMAIEELIGQVASSAAGVCWAVDSTGGSAALLLALLVAADQPVVYVPGRTVNRMAEAFAGEAKTDARDALVIAQTARMRQDLGATRPRPELVTELAVLVGHRTDLMVDWVRTVSRLRGCSRRVFLVWSAALTSPPAAPWCWWPATRPPRRCARWGAGGWWPGCAATSQARSPIPGSRKWPRRPWPRPPLRRSGCPPRR